MMEIMVLGKLTTQDMVSDKIIGVTGSSGFIGGAVCIGLKRKGFNVVALDLVKRRYLIPHIDKFFLQDFNQIPLRDSLSWFDCDAIVHCAGTSLVGPSICNPINYYNNNVAKTINLLDWCVRYKKHFIFSSSASVYKSSNIPLKEEDQLAPLSPYARSKLMVETVVSDFVASHGLKATIFRYFNACGSFGDLHGQMPGSSHIFPRLFEDKEFTLFGEDFATPDGTCIRDYVHVIDIVNAHIKAIENSVYGIYNLGSGTGYSNRQIINAMGVKTWKKGARRIGDSDCLIADNSLAKSELGWSPTLTLENIIEDLKLWYGSKTYSGLLAHPAL